MLTVADVSLARLRSLLITDVFTRICEPGSLKRETSTLTLKTATGKRGTGVRAREWGEPLHGMKLKIYFRTVDEKRNVMPVGVPR